MDVSGAREEEAKAIVGDGIGHRIRDIGDEDTVLRCGLEIDAIGTDSATGHEFEFG